VELVTMPQLGETVTEGTIIRWHKQVGDEVAVDDVLFEVSTEKVDTEVPSAHAGVLRAVHVPEGDTVPVGTLLAVITQTADEPLEEVTAATPPPASAPATAETASPAPTTSTATAPRGPAASAPAASATTAPPRAPRPSADHNGFLSPVVRALLDEHGLHPDEVVGTGTDGRITRNDVLAAAANAPRATPPAAPASTVPSASAALPIPQPGPDDDVVEFTKARRATADHMVRSLATSAHTLVATEVDYHRVDPIRRRAGLSFLPFVARATIDALGEFGHLNASVGDDQLIVHRRIHLGVAVDVRFEALVVPIVHDAGDMRLTALADAMAAQAEKARTKRLTGEDLSGGTFTITNVGTYGTIVTAPVINQPQVAILSTDSVRMRPTAVRSAAGEWTVAVHPLGNLSLSFDHRAVDGAYAAAFLARVRELLETRDWTQELG
jgi:pyruvate dehydrogenase E2 component (dihydrolipoyllysine-residue acetyltransferase)